MSNKVVVVDDDPKVVMLLESTLQKLGFEVFSAGNGNIALELIKKEKPHLVISDMLIPGMHGVELCRAIKSDDELSDTPVILITAVYGKRDYASGDMEAGADAFIEKPIDVKMLSNIIGKLRDWS